MRQLVCVSVRSWLFGIWVMVFVLWVSLEADCALFDKDEIEFYAETCAAFCAVTIHLVIEAWIHAWKRWVRRLRWVARAVPAVVQVDGESVVPVVKIDGKTQKKWN